MSPTFLNRNPRTAQHERLNVLLSNGRFPVSLDLARQLHKAGHVVYTVDPMEFHVCKFSYAVKRSWETPAPSEDPAGYIKIVKEVIQEVGIDMIIPMHEEILYLAECGDQEIVGLLFAPSFLELYRLHNKWEFNATLQSCGLDKPEAYLCTSRADVEALDKDKEWALKPVLGRSSSGVHHLAPGKRIDLESVPVSPDTPHIAQEWLLGNRYCTYGVFRKGNVLAFSVYPVLETIDGSSAVYFEAVEHDEIRAYVLKLVKELRLSGQLAFDFIEMGDEDGEIKDSPRGKYRQFGQRIRHPFAGNGKKESAGTARPSDETKSSSSAGYRLVAIECNPRATSGIHLWSGTPQLARNFSDRSGKLPEVAARPGVSRQTAPGMFMWEHERANARRYFQHLKRLLRAKDVIWNWRDFMPAMMQPFLLASYYRICHDKGGIPLSEMFQSDLIWNPGIFGDSKAMGLTGARVGQLMREWAPKKDSEGNTC